MEPEKCVPRKRLYAHGTRQGRTNPSGPAASQGMQEKIQNHRIYTSVNHFLVLVFRVRFLTPFNPLSLFSSLLSSSFRNTNRRGMKTKRCSCHQNRWGNPCRLFFFARDVDVYEGISSLSVYDVIWNSWSFDRLLSRFAFSKPFSLCLNKFLE